VLLIIVAIFLDIIFGDPSWFPHPIIFIGKLIGALEKKLYSKASKMKGLLLVFITCVVVWSAAELIIYLSALVGIDDYVIAFFLYTSLAIKSLAKAGRDIKDAISKGIDEARLKLSYIVGRDTKDLDEQEIIKGAVETVAENTIDGVIAPIFYMLIGLIINAPLQLVFLYKTINTLDSMVGYNNEKYSNLGYFAAKIDDVLNFIPARIGSVVMLISGMLLGYDIKSGIKIFSRDRKNHKSPNSAHPESVIAGLLNIRLGGPNYYFGKLVDKPYIGEGEKELSAGDITKTNRVLYMSVALITLTLILLEVFI